MRERQAMQTGVNSKLPTTPNAESLAGAARSRPSFVSLTRAPRHMIQQRWGNLEAKRPVLRVKE
jgi:hypothetical protein